MSEMPDSAADVAGVQPVAIGRHFPADPNKFVFDASVAAIFDDMAERSIPGYGAYFDRITRILAQRRLPEWSQVWDMGVSTGAGLDAVHRAVFHPFVEFYGVDISVPMLTKASERAPYATMLEHDLEKGLPDQLEKGNVSVIMWSWTLQFLQHYGMRRDLLRQSAQALHPEGFIFIGEKFRNPDPVIQQVNEDAYYTWRMANGYSGAEIKAKSKALANAMYPWLARELYDFAEANNLIITPLFQQFNFGGFVLRR